MNDENHRKRRKVYLIALFALFIGLIGLTLPEDSINYTNITLAGGNWTIDSNFTNLYPVERNLGVTYWNNKTSPIILDFSFANMTDAVILNYTLWINDTVSERTVTLFGFGGSFQHFIPQGARYNITNITSGSTPIIYWYEHNIIMAPSIVNNYYNTTGSGGVSFNGSPVNLNGSSFYNGSNQIGTFNHSNLTNLAWNVSGHTGLTQSEIIKTVGVGKDYTTIQGCYDSIPAIITGNITCLIDPGTYTESLKIAGKSSTGDYWISFKSASRNIIKNDKSTSGSSGTISTQSWLQNTSAGYTVNSLIGKWINITSGTESGKIRLINNNSATRITLVGGYFSTTPGTDNFTIYDNNVLINGDITVSHSPIETRFEGIDIKGLSVVQTKLILTEVNQTVDGYFNNHFSLAYIDYYRTYHKGVSGVNGLWYESSNPTFFSSFYDGMKGVYSWGVLLQGGGQNIMRCGTVVNNTDAGVWADLGGSSNLNGEGDAQCPNPTTDRITNNAIGLYAVSGGHIYGIPIFSGNAADKSAEAASFSWIS